jgi:hypothetical protein
MTSTNPPSTPNQPPGAATPEPKAKKIDLSLSQTLGGALAAMTAATIGSRLGVAGTIVGAALASIIAGVATTLYTASLRTTREKVQTVWSGRIAGTNTPASVDLTTEQANTAEQAPVWEPTEAAAPAAPRPRRELPWKRMVVGALAVFAIAAVALTGFELLSGSALSGGQGTTIQQVTKEGKESKPTTKADASDSASPTASPTASASPTPSEASQSPSEQPSVAPTPSTGDTPSATPSTETATPTVTPSASTTPSIEATPVR